MQKVITDQAEGLRRLMGENLTRLVVFLGSDPAEAKSVALNLTGALLQQGHEVLFVNESDETLASPVRRQGQLVVIHASLDREGALSPLAAQADHVVVVVRANAYSIKASYACIKRLHNAHALKHLRVLVNGVADAAEAHRILANLAHTGSRYLALALEPAGWVRSDPFLAQARRVNLAVVEAFKSSPAAVDFRQIASALLYWPHSPAQGRPPSSFPNTVGCHDGKHTRAMP